RASDAVRRCEAGATVHSRRRTVPWGIGTAAGATAPEVPPLRSKEETPGACTTALARTPPRSSPCPPYRSTTPHPGRRHGGSVRPVPGLPAGPRTQFVGSVLAQGADRLLHAPAVLGVGGVEVGQVLLDHVVTADLGEAA